MVLERDQPSRLRARLNAPRLAVWGCVLGLLSAGLAGAQVGPVVSKDKKLIGWACDRINAREFRMRVVELERHLPFDGLVITVSPDAFELEDGRYARWFGGKRHHRKDFQQVIEDLKATKDTRFTDNFIDFETTVRFDPAPEEANLDWFDPKWSVIAENAAVAAHVAKEGRFKGLFIDVEAYAGGLGPWRTPFNHVSYATLTRADGKTPRTLEACVEQVRKRGRQFMRAVTEVYPDITIVMIQDTGWGSGPLVTAFVEGILEVRGEATLVDGAEQAYRMMTYQEIKGLRDAARRRQPGALYDGMERGFGIWWDWRTSADMQTFKAKDVQKNVRNPERLEHALYNALTAADRYVWVYSFGAYIDSVWWHSSYRNGKDWSIRIPDPYVEAFGNCRKPHDLSWVPGGRNPRVNFDGVVLVLGDKVTPGVKNLLSNGDFASWSRGPEEAPDGWTLINGEMVSGESSRVRRDATAPKIGRYSPQLGMATLGDTGHISLDQAVEASAIAGKTVTFGAWIRTMYPDMSNVEIVGVNHGITTTVSPPDAQGWRFHTMTGPIPDQTIEPVLFRLRIFVEYSPE